MVETATYRIAVGRTIQAMREAGASDELIRGVLAFVVHREWVQEELAERIGPTN